MQSNLLKPLFVVAVTAALTSLSLFTTGCSSTAATPDPAASPSASPSPVASASPTAAAAVSALAGAFPTGLAVSAFANPTSATAVSLKKFLGEKFFGGAPVETEYDPTKQNTSDKAADQQALIDGTVDTCFSANILQNVKPGQDPGCYMPDKDIFEGQGVVSGEACLVSYARYKMTSAIGRVDQVVNMVGAMFCQAKKSNADVTLPAIGAELDLKTTMVAAVAANTAVTSAPTITSAKITRLADVGTRPVYKTDLVYTNSTRTRTVHLVNSPGDTADEFNGTLWISEENSATPAEKNHYISVTYAKTGTTSATQRIIYEVREADIAPSAGDPFTTAGQLDYNVSADFSVATDHVAYGQYPGPDNAVISGFNYLSFNVNPNTNEGSFAFWNNPGQNYTENARGMIFNITATADGVLSGCGVSGSAGGQMGSGAVSIRRSIKESAANADMTLTPRGYYHPNPTATGIVAELNGSQFQNGTKVYKQCFAQNATSGLYEVANVTDLTNNFDVIATAANPVAPPDIAAATPFEVNIKE